MAPLLITDLCCSYPIECGSLLQLMNGCIEVVGKNWTRDGGFLIVNDLQFFPTTSMTAWSYMQHTAMSGAEHDALRQPLTFPCFCSNYGPSIWKFPQRWRP